MLRGKKNIQILNLILQQPL